MSNVWSRVGCNWFWRLLTGVLFGFILGSAGSWTIDKFTQNNQPPVIFSKVEALNSPVAAGDRLDVRIYRTKPRTDCPAVHSVRYATNKDGKVFEIPDRIWEGGKPKTDHLDYAYDVSALPIGQYTLHVQLTYYCDGGRQVFPIEQPPVNFRIVR